MAIKYQQGPVKSGLVGTMFVIDREEHVLHIVCPVFQQILLDEMIFQIFTFRYNTVLRTTKKIKYKMNLKYKKFGMKIRSHYVKTTDCDHGRSVY